MGPRRELGLSKSNAVTIYYALDQAQFLTDYKRDNGPINRTPEQINADIISARNRGETRKYVAIIEGALGTLEYYRDRLTESDIIIYIADLATLKALGVDIPDEHWTKDDEQLNLNGMLGRQISGGSPRDSAENGIVAGLLSVAASALLSRWKNRKIGE